MITTKLFEIRDCGTFVPAMAAMLSRSCGKNAEERFLLHRAGYGGDCLLLTHLGTCESHCDEYDWTSNRTMSNAHLHIFKNWDSLESGSVIDIEMILGETSTPKLSERLEAREQQKGEFDD